MIDWSKGRRGLFLGKKVALASTTRLDTIPPAVLRAFQRGVFETDEILMTDESRLRDFMDLDRNNLNRNAICWKILYLYGIECFPGDLVVDILERIIKK